MKNTVQGMVWNGCLPNKTARFGPITHPPSRTLGSRQKIIAPSCLVFGPSASVALKAKYLDMQLSMRFADEPNPGVIRHNYFLPRPLNYAQRLERNLWTILYIPRQ
jgi:hypothetical protein